MAERVRAASRHDTAAAEVVPGRRESAGPALAAALSLVVLAGGMLLRGETAPWDIEIASGTLTGTQVFEAEHVIRADQVRIATGSEVTFRVADRVTLGEGFTVESGATFRVESTRRPERARE